MTTPLPTPPSSLRPTTFNADTDTFLAALPLFQTEMDALAGTLSPVGRNVLMNSAFKVCQRAVGSVADDVYMHDCWYALTQTAAIANSIISDPENGFTHAMRLTQSQVAAQRFGFAQAIEGKNCKHLRNGSGTLSGRVRCSVATTIRYAIIGWTGTEDSLTSDFVLSWTNGAFTAGNFFNSTTLSILGTGSIAVASNVWTSLTILTAALGTAFTNLAVMVWTDSAQAQNVTLDCDYLQLEAGASASPLEQRSYQSELLNCQRYFQRRDFGNVEKISVLAALTVSAASGKMFDLCCPMRADPTVTIAAGQFVAWDAAQAVNSNFSSPAYSATSFGTVSVLTSIGSGLFVAGNAVLITGGGSGATVHLSAEL